MKGANQRLVQKRMRGAPRRQSAMKLLNRLSLPEREKDCSSCQEVAFSLRMRRPFSLSGTSGSFFKFNSFSFFFFNSIKTFFKKFYFIFYSFPTTPIVHKLCGLLIMLSGLLRWWEKNRWFVVLRASKEVRRQSMLYHVGCLVLLFQGGNEEGREKWFGRPFMLPRAVTQAEWHPSFSLDEIYKFELQRPKQFLH